MALYCVWTLALPVSLRLGASLDGVCTLQREDEGSEAGGGVSQPEAGMRVFSSIVSLLRDVSGTQPDFPPSPSQLQTLEGSPVPPTHPPSCRRPPWRTCCACTPPSPVRTTPPLAVRPPPRCPSRLSSVPQSCVHLEALTGSCPHS